MFDIGGVNVCSDAYNNGETLGIITGALVGGYGGWRAAGSKMADGRNFPNEQFSHWIPERFIRPMSISGKNPNPDYKWWLDNKFGRWLISGHNKFNGNYVHVRRHFKHDPHATGNRQFPGRTLGDKWHPFWRMLDRVPRVYYGVGVGTAVYGASAYGVNCECR